MNIRTVAITLAAGMLAATSAFSGPNAPEASAVEKASQAGFGNAALYWRNGVTITDPKDIKETCLKTIYLYAVL
jgi:hypothetical protein